MFAERLKTHNYESRFSLKCLSLNLSIGAQSLEKTNEKQKKLLQNFQGQTHYWDSSALYLLLLIGKTNITRSLVNSSPISGKCNVFLNRPLNFVEKHFSGSSIEFLDT